MKDYQKDSFAVLQKDKERIEKEIEVLIEQKMRETIMNPSMKYMIDEMYNETINDKYKMIEYLEKQINDSINIEAKESEIRKNFKGTIHLLDDIINTKDITKKQVLQKFGKEIQLEIEVLGI